MCDHKLNIGAKLQAHLKDNIIVICLTVLALISRISLVTISLGEVDSGNFCNSLQYGYDITLFRPHAPGYPIFIFMAWPLYLITSDCIFSLGMVSAVLGGLVIIPFYLLMKDIGGTALAVAGSLLLIVNPLHWSFSTAMLSDVPSTFFVVLAGYFLYRGISRDWAFLLGCGFMSIAIGVRPANVCIILLLAVPLFLRWKNERTLPVIPMVSGIAVFGIISSLWFFPGVLLGSDDFTAYLGALQKQWSNAVSVGDISQLREPWLIQLFYRVERFAVGYLLVYPWTGSDTKNLVSLLLCVPVILGFIGFVCAWRRVSSDHVFITTWLVTIFYPIFSIHFLPRYGIPYIPVFIILLLLGYRAIWSIYRMKKGSIELMFLLCLDVVLMLYIIKLQEPVSSFEVNPPGEPFYIGLLLILFLVATLWLRMRFQHWYTLVGNVGDNEKVRWVKSSWIMGLSVILVTPYVLVGYTNASISHNINSPGHQLVLDVTRQYSPNESVVCWDNQTHSIFESLAPQFSITGRLGSDALYESYENGEIILLTDRCQWYDEISNNLDLVNIGSYDGASPIWSKAPQITAFLAMK